MVISVGLYISAFRARFLSNGPFRFVSLVSWSLFLDFRYSLDRGFEYEADGTFQSEIGVRMKKLWPKEVDQGCC